MNVHFDPGTRQTAGTEEPCFQARYLQNRLDGDRWVPYEAPLRFSFQEAEFREEPAG